MKRNSALITSQFLLILLAAVMISIGAVFAETFLLQPILTGIGFLVIAWTLNVLKRKTR